MIDAAENEIRQRGNEFADTENDAVGRSARAGETDDAVAVSAFDGDRPYGRNGVRHTAAICMRRHDRDVVVVTECASQSPKPGGIDTVVICDENLHGEAEGS